MIQVKELQDLAREHVGDNKSPLVFLSKAEEGKAAVIAVFVARSDSEEDHDEAVNAAMRCACLIAAHDDNCAMEVEDKTGSVWMSPAFELMEREAWEKQQMGR